MNILDIAQNAVRAGASLCEITLFENTAEARLLLTIRDDGCGMDEETVARVTDPFFTSRTTRKVGLGLPFLKMAAELTGGELSIGSQPGVGTTVSAQFTLGHIDLMPLGDMGATLSSLAAGNPEINFFFTYYKDELSFVFDTRQMKEFLGDVSLSEPTVAIFVRDYVNEHMDAVSAGRTPEEE